jgi:hypothetical protein
MVGRTDGMGHILASAFSNSLMRAVSPTKSQRWHHSDVLRHSFQQHKAIIISLSLGILIKAPSSAYSGKPLIIFKMVELAGVNRLVAIEDWYHFPMATSM